MPASLNFAEAASAAIARSMTADPTVVVIGQGVGRGGPSGEFAEAARLYPNRVVDTAVSEGLIVGAAVGGALTGLKPVAFLGFTDFVLSAMDELANQAAKLRYMSGGGATVPMVLFAYFGPYPGGAAHHSQGLEGVFTQFPGLKVVSPSNAGDLAGLLVSSIADPDPVVFLVSKRPPAVRDAVDEAWEAIPLRMARVARSGRDVSVIAYGSSVDKALAAAEAVAGAHGIDAEVIDLRSLAPLDFAAISASIEKTGRAVVCQEDTVAGGFAAQLSAAIGERLFSRLRSPVIRVSARPVPMPFAPTLEKAVIPTVGDLEQAIARAAQGSRSVDQGAAPSRAQELIAGAGTGSERDPP
jgi:pyruvate/2-oxoglutarate/acetoin dehydrogenase E1 component